MSENKTYWLGLESYDENNASIFYGRDAEIQGLATAIFNHTQTVIYGPSGTGKTSIIRAGIFKLAREKHFMPVYVRLSHEKDSKPYSRQIIDAITEEATKTGVDIEQAIEYIDGANDNVSLWEYFHCNEFWSHDNYPITPLIVLDQFEEIFTLGLRNSEREDFFIQLSDLCSNSYPAYITEYLKNRNNKPIVYPDSVNYRLVLSLREDFLARVEELSDSIPALKRNRFSLQAMNGNQALDVIEKPAPNLVSHDVATLILMKVSGSKDDSIKPLEELNIEPSILSLFCRELDRERRKRNLSVITPELIAEYGDHIIDDFYLESISTLSPDNVEELENKLLTSNGFRNSVALADLLANGFTQDDIKHLAKRRIIRVEDRDGTKRVEFTHDVLCRVALKHKNDRKQLELAEEETRRAAAITKRSKYRMISLIAIAVILIACGMFLFFGLTHKTPEPVIYTRVISNPASLDFIVDEDSIFVSPDDYWEADFKISITGPQESYDTVISRSKTDMGIAIPSILVDSASIVNVDIFFKNNYNNFEDRSLSFDSTALAACDYRISLPVTRQVKTYKGKVMMVNNHDVIPIRNQQVILFSDNAYTDNDGVFTLRMAVPSEEVRPIILTRDNLKIKRETAESGGFDYIFEYSPTDNINEFKSKVNLIDSLYEAALVAPEPHRYRYDIPFDNSNDALTIIYTKPQSNGYTEGFFYFKNDKDKCSDPINAHYLFKGQIDTKYNRLGLRNFTFFGKDVAGNDFMVRAVVKRHKMYIIISSPTMPERLIKTIKGHCPSCGKSLEDNWTKCERCGKKL